MLRVEHLTVEAGGRLILNDVSLAVEKGETVVLFGPNGSGKSTFIKAIMNLSGYDRVSGVVTLDGIALTGEPVSVRAKAGLGIMFQHPARIYGIKLSQMAGLLTGDPGEVAARAEELHVTSFLGQDLNVNLSGGEMKRVELFQLLLQKPKMLLLDEPESGVDVENISLMGTLLNDYLKRTSCGCLIITHTGHILDYIDASRACVMTEGRLSCHGRPKVILAEIRKYGYERCRECRCPDMMPKKN